MNFSSIQKKLAFVICILLCTNSFAASRVIALDGVSGFVGYELLQDLSTDNLRIGCHNCDKKIVGTHSYIQGTISDPNYLKKLTQNLDVYLQMAAISSVESDEPLKEYIVVNSLGPYIASRLNKSMLLLSFSTIATADIAQDEQLNAWINSFVIHFTNSNTNVEVLSALSLSKNLDKFLYNNPPPSVNKNQYYSLSKILSEKLLQQSATARDGKIIMIRPALIIGGDITRRRGKSVIKNILDAIYFDQKTYEVWNRTNWFTPLHKLKAMILYIINNTEQFAAFEIFDSGFVTLSQHDLVTKLISTAKRNSTSLILLNNSPFSRTVAMSQDERLVNFYPVPTDIDRSVQEMVSYYKNLNLD